MYSITFVEMSPAKKTVVDAEVWTARNTAINMYPGHAINSKSLHMCVTTVQRTREKASFSFAYGFEVLEIYRHFLIVEL